MEDAEIYPGDVVQEAVSEDEFVKAQKELKRE